MAGQEGPSWARSDPRANVCLLWEHCYWWGWGRDADLLYLKTQLFKETGKSLPHTHAHLSLVVVPGMESRTHAYQASALSLKSIF